MSKIVQKYKELFDGQEQEISVSDSGRIVLPDWAFWLFIHKSGLKSRKNRLLKKRIKREIERAVNRGLK